MMLEGISERLLIALNSLPVTQSYDGRTSLLSGIPHTGLNRSEGNQEVDLSRLVDQLAPLRNSEGTSYLLLFIDSAIRVARHTQWEDELRELREALRQTPPTEPVSPSRPTAAGEDDLHKSLVQVLRRSKQTERYSGRSELLRGIPENLTSGLTRNEEDRRLDVRAIVYGMAAKGQLDDGRYPLLIVIENALEPEESAELGRELKTIQKALIALNASEVVPTVDDVQLTAKTSGLPPQTPPSNTVEVQVALATFQANLTMAVQEIELLRCLKGLHDCLHEVEFRYRVIRLDVAPRFPTDWQAVESLERYAFDLQGLVEKTTELAASPVLSGTPAWIGRLTEVDDLLQKTLTSREKTNLDRCLVILKHILAREPAEINRQLISTASVLRPAQIEADMLRLSEQLKHVVRDAQRGRESLARLLGTIDEFAHFRPKFEQTVKAHSHWQSLDSELRGLEIMLNTNMDEMIVVWPGVCTITQSLRQDETERWPARLDETEQKLDMALENRDASEINRYFNIFTQLIRTRFFEVDNQLKAICGELARIVDPRIFQLYSLE